MIYIWFIFINVKRRWKIFISTKKNKFANQVSTTELELFENELNLKTLNRQYNVFNNKIMNQIKSISKKIYKNNN